ncbi:MAG TPA: peptide chain release factor N(5)-glutamine methyltransferase [Anaerolineae bacterium]|nr:peptide chain release factor N(5)-glutamine methyltransferase [Anaerolineae bacterium]
MQIREALTQAIESLRNQEVESPRLDAELLLAEVLRVNRAALLTWPERRLSPKQLTSYRDSVARRAAREPLAYITGHREFFGLDLAVDPRVLIPRPETELLVERAIEIGRGMRERPTIADVGAGSGAIAVSLAVHLTGATVYALDSSVGALDVVAANARRHGVAERVHCLQGDLLGPLPETVDLVAANLPYVTTEEWEALPPEIRVYEPRAALDGGSDGLDHIRRLFVTAGPHLRPSGTILVEIGAGQGASVTALAREACPGAEVELCQDLAQLDRLVVVRYPK